MEYGYTCNLSARRGKWITYLPLFLPVPFCIGLIGLFAWMDFTPFTLSIQEDLITVHAPLYQDTFSLEEIEDLSLTDTIPSGKRTGGAATSRYLLGNFQVKGYGKSRLYVYLNEVPAVVIRLSDRTFFIQAKTEEESLRVYQELLRNTDIGKRLRNQ